MLTIVLLKPRFLDTQNIAVLNLAFSKNEAVRSGSTLFTHAYLSKNLGKYEYTYMTTLMDGMYLMEQ